MIPEESRRSVQAVKPLAIVLFSRHSLVAHFSVRRVIAPENPAMFTGLVEGQGTIAKVQPLEVGLRLTIAPDDDCFSAADTALGDSISICGCCLTVVAKDSASFDFEAGEETLSKTTLGTFRQGTRVNLERSLLPSSRLGGHFVQGHVDGTAKVLSVNPDGEWTTIWFAPAEAQRRLLVSKGSVAVDGVSLTVVDVSDAGFSVALIPHTLAVTTLGKLQAGDLVNIENDILGKYVDHLLAARLSGVSPVAPSAVAATGSLLSTDGSSESQPSQ